MGKKIPVLLAFLMLASLAACSRPAASADGTVRVNGSGGTAYTYRLVEIGKTDGGKTCVYIQGSESGEGKTNDACSYEFSGGGFEWSVKVGASIAYGGKQYDPVETIPYLSTRPGNVVCLVFDTGEAPETVTIFSRANENGGATLTVSELELDPELAISGKIAEIKD